MGKVAEQESSGSEVPCIPQIPSSPASLLVSVCHCVTLLSRSPEHSLRAQCPYLHRKGLVPRCPQPILGLRGEEVGRSLQ